MPVAKPIIPDGESFSIKEIADQWECTVGQVESYIYDYKLLRLSMVTEHVCEFQELAPEKLGVFLSHSNNDIQSLYTGITEDSQRAEKIASLEFVDLNHPLANDGVYEFVDVDWVTKVPKFLYINLNNGFVLREGILMPIRHLRLKRDENIRLKGFETFDGDGIEVRRIEQNTVVEIEIQNPVITREEHDRFVDLYRLSANKQSTGIASEQERLLTIIGLLTLALRKWTGDYFDLGKTFNRSALAQHINSVVKEETGLKESSLKRRIDEGLSLVSKKK